MSTLRCQPMFCQVWLIDAIKLYVHVDYKLCLLKMDIRTLTLDPSKAKAVGFPKRYLTQPAPVV